MAESRFEAAEQDFLEALSKAPPAHRPMARLNLAESLLARGQGLGAAEEARAAEAEAISAGRTSASPRGPPCHRAGERPPCAASRPISRDRDGAGEGPARVRNPA